MKIRQKMQGLFLPIVIFVVSISLEIECRLTRRLNFDAVVYEDFSIDSRSIQYSRSDKEMWKNMKELMEKNALMDNAMLCTRGRGTWIGFEETDYKPEGMGVALIVGENCLPARGFKSIEPIGDIRKNMLNSMVLFSMSNFGGEQQIMTEKDATASMDAKSLVIYGRRKEYLVEGSGPDGTKKVCMRPQKNNKLCIMRDVDTSLGMQGAKSFKSDGECSKMDDPSVIILYLETCYDEGLHYLVNNKAMSPKNIMGMCSGDVDQLARNSMALVSEVFEARITRLMMRGRPLISMPPEGTFKEMVFGKIMDIFSHICTVNVEYISILRMVFLIRLRETWKMDMSKIGIEDDKWKEMMHYLLTCDSASAAGAGARFLKASPCRRNLAEPRNDQEREAFEEMMNGERFDTVIDQIWMIFEMVYPYCNDVNEFDDNKWTEMLPLLRKYFLGPLSMAWRNPGTWQQLYPTMFRGFNIEHNKRQIMMCTQNMALLSSARDPMLRVTWAEEMDNEPPVMKSRKVGSRGR